MICNSLYKVLYIPGLARPDFLFVLYSSTNLCMFSQFLYYSQIMSLLYEGLIETNVTGQNYIKPT